MADYLPLERLDKRPFRNILHEFDSYNYSIVLRVFKLEDLDKFTIEGGRPKNWDVFDDTTVTLAATGGSFSFPNRWGNKDQSSDTFIENVTMTIPVGVRGVFGGNTGSSFTITVKEPNGINFLPTILTAWNVKNEYSRSKVLSSLEQVPVLLSIFFNVPSSALGTSSSNNSYAELPDTTRHIPIQILSVKTQLTSSGATYTIEGCTFATSAQFTGSQRPIYETITELRGYKIGDFLNDLMSQMNSKQAEMTRDPTSGEPRTIYSYSVVPVGKNANIFFERTLSATIAEGGSIADTPMKSPQELLDLYAAAPEGSTGQTAGQTIGTIQAQPLKFTDETKKRRRQRFLEAMDKYGIVDPAERAQFYAQCLHESGNFRFLVEQANGKAYDITVNPKKAQALGNTAPGDGPRYKGRGFIQVTGKANYAACGAFIKQDIVNSPALLEREDLACESACWFWIKNLRPQMSRRPNTNSYIRTGKPRTPVDFTNTYLVTHIVNGGFNGLEDRLVKFEQAKLDKDVTKGKTVASTGTIAPLQGSTATAQQQGQQSNPSNTAQPAAPDKDAIEAAQKRKELQQSILNAANGDAVTSPVRTIKIGKEMTVTTVVELLALNSTYCLEAIKNIDTEGMPAFIPYVKVYPTYEFEGYDPQFNVLKKRVTFNVVGVEWASPTLGPESDAEAVANAIKNNTVRGYNYLFTGKNTDVLSLDLNFDGLYNNAIAAFTNAEFAGASASAASIPTDGATSPVSATESNQTPPSASGSLVSTAMVLPDRDNTSKGMPRDFNQTELKFKSLLPGVFANAATLTGLDMEIIGDPELIPKSEFALNAEEFRYHYLKWEASRDKPVNDRSAFEFTSFSPTYFLFTVGNPDPTQRSNAMIAGYYIIQQVVANFKDSGAFTMNINASKETRLTVSTEAAREAGLAANEEVKQNKEAAKDFSTTSKELTNALNQTINLPNSSTLTSTLKSLAQTGLSNFEQTLSTGLSTAAGSFANTLLNSFSASSPSTAIPKTVVEVLSAGSIAGAPSDENVPTTTLPETLGEAITGELTMFVNIDPNPTKDVTKAVTNALFDQFAAEDKAAADLENFIGSLLIGPDLANQAQNLLSGAVNSIGNAVGNAVVSGLTSAASDITSSILGKSPALLSGNGKALAATGNLTTTSNSVGNLLGQAVRTTVSAPINSASALTSLVPDFKIPGAPGLTTENSAALQPSLEGALTELSNKNAISSAATDVIAGATASLDLTAQNIQTQLNAPVSSDMLKLESQATFSRISNISKGIKVQSPTLATAASSLVSTATRTVSAVGGQMSMPGSSSSLSAVASSAASSVGGSVVKSAESVINNATNNPLMSASSVDSLTTSFTQDATASLDGLSADVVAAISAAQPQTAKLIKNLPLDVSTMSALSAGQIAGIKEQIAVATLAGSGLAPNISAGSISTDINSLIVSAKGLAAKSLPNVSQTVSVSIKGVI